MYLGQSLDHHTTVGKILSFQTGYVSPQFHCIYDKLFTSCFGTVTDTVFDKDHWDSMLQFGVEHASHMDPVSPDPAKREQIACIQQDLFNIFRHPDHVTPPPSTVPEGDGPILPLQIDDEGTSDSEGDARNDSEGAPANEGAPDNTEQAVPPAGAATCRVTETSAKTRDPIC